MIRELRSGLVTKKKVNDMQATDLTGAVWRKSSRSGGDNGSQCVEVAVLDGLAGLRDSKQQGSATVHAPALVFPVSNMTAFLAVTKRGDWDQA